MYKLTTKTNEFDVGIDLRKESKNMINQYGINMLYVRNQKLVRCSCFNDLNKTGDPKCKKCFGSGYFASIQKVKASESSNSAYSSTNDIIQTNIGQTSQKNEIYYLPFNKVPKERDILLKVTWKNDCPIDVVMVLEIVNIWEMRGDNGRVELYGCVVNNRTDLANKFQKALMAMSSKGIHEILKGGKYIWPYRVLS